MDAIDSLQLGQAARRAVLEILISQCKVLRRSKDPQRALVAAELEIKLQQEIDQLNQGDHHAVVHN